MIDPSVCPTCGSATKVIDSRTLEGAIRRRRACKSYPASHRFTTYETTRLDQNAILPVLTDTDMLEIRRILNSRMRELFLSRSKGLL